MGKHSKLDLPADGDGASDFSLLNSSDNSQVLTSPYFHLAAKEN